MMQAAPKRRKSWWAFKALLAQRRPRLPAIAAVLAGATALHLVPLMRYPPPFVDEAWLAARAWMLLRSGIAFSSLDSGVVDRFPGYWTTYPWLLPRIQSLAIRALGLSLFSVRLVSLLFGLLLLAALYTIGKELVSRRVALLAVLSTAISVAFLQSAHVARYDIITAALGYTAAALFIADRASGLSLQSTLAGLVLGLAFEIHVNAAIYGPAIVALYLLDQGWSGLRAPRLWGFVGGVCAGLALYVGVHILPYAQTFVQVNRLAFGPTHTPPLLTASPRVWLDSVRETILLTLWAGAFQGPLPFVGLVSLLFRRSASDKRLALFFVAVLMGFAVLIRNKASYYAILVFPAASLAAAAFLAKLWQERREISRQNRRMTQLAATLLLVLSCGLVLGAILNDLRLVADDPMPDYKSTVERIRQAVPQGSSLMGSQTFWFGMPEKRYYSWEVLPTYRYYAPGSTLADAFSAVRPDYLVIDEHMAQSIVTDTVGMDVYYQHIALSQPELEGFLAGQARLVDSFWNRTYGSIQIYRITWDTSLEHWPCSLPTGRAFPLPYGRGSHRASATGSPSPS